MDFSIRFTEEGKESLHRIHIDNQKKIKVSLKKFSKDVKSKKKLLGRLYGFYSLVVGKYRVIYTLEEDVILVHYVGHRSDVYDDFEGKF